MTRAPYTVRLAAGLIVTALEETRKLPTQLITLPMTAVSNAVQAGMRLQQNVAELVIKGDAVLDDLFDKPEEQPAWAVFDDDEVDTATDVPVGLRSTPVPPAPVPAAAPAMDAAAPDAPESATAAGRFALYSSVPAVPDSAGPAAKAPSGPSPEVADFLDYDNLTLAQLRAKIRSVDVDDLRALADYERASRNRTPFLTMLENRIAAKSDR